MRVLCINAGADTGGSTYFFQQAFRGHDIDVRGVARSGGPLQFPTDLPWSKAASAYQAADVVNLHNSAKPRRLFGPKPFVLHHHGTKYRRRADVYNQFVSDHGGRATVSTLDLLEYGDGLEWIPHPWVMADLAKHRQPLPLDGRKLRVGHAPTNRGIKDTAAFLAACAKVDVEPVLIEGRTWAQCLAIKGTCDVLYDQVQLGYGSNAVEAWAMGIPVICGAADWTMRRYRDTFGSAAFFVYATRTSIADAIRDLSTPDAREEWAVRGKNHAHQWHDGRVTRERLARIWSGLV